MFKLKRDVEYNKWFYKNGEVYLTESYTNIFGRRKQKEVSSKKYYEVMLNEKVKDNYGCE